MLDQTTKHRQKNISTKIPCFFSPGRSLTRPPIPTDPTYLLSVKSANQAIYFWKLNVNQSTTSIPLSTRTAPLHAQGRAVSPSPASCRRCLLPRDAASPRRPPPQLAILGAPARGPRPQRAAPLRPAGAPWRVRAPHRGYTAGGGSVPPARCSASARRGRRTGLRFFARCVSSARRSSHSSPTVYSSPFLLVLVCID